MNLDKESILANLANIENQIGQVKQQLGTPSTTLTTSSGTCSMLNNTASFTQVSNVTIPERSSNTMSPIPLYDQSQRDKVQEQMKHLFPQISNDRKRKRNNLADGLNSNPFVKDSFTREYTCLPLVTSVTTPSSQMAMTLEYAGLGKKKITLPSNANHAEVVANIHSAYPRLKECGFFTMHKAKRGGNCQPLQDMNLDSYDVNSLRKKFKSKSLIYLRPLQKNLDLSLVTKEEI
ncbi:uncharacterized protein [Clytia hemisphaerica]|uniref:uncharacterized protein isoform X2 n=1 Tax=Clytia hemisphaerica TaxID=252671 RepID=UPI0034D54EEC